MKATQPHHLAVPKGSRFWSIVSSYLKAHNLNTEINPLFTVRHMNYDHGLFESLNAFLTIVMVIDQDKQRQITKFLNSRIMRDLSNEEYRLSSEDLDRKKALDFINQLI